MYKIKIVYTTGSTFESSIETRFLKYQDEQWNTHYCCWNNVEIAKENLQRIKEYTEWYNAIHNGSYFTKKENKKLTEAAQTKPWYAVGKSDYNLKLKFDDGSEKNIGAFWVGYFEHIHSAEIISDSSDMRIDF